MGDKLISSSLIMLFDDVISPAMSLITEQDDDEDDLHTINIPDEFAVRIGGGSKVYDIFKDVEAFDELPLLMRKGILDALYLMLRRGTYDVVRFRCHETGDSEDRNLIHLLLNLLGRYNRSKELLSLSKRIIRLLGIICAPAISPSDLKRFLKFLRSPSLISNSLLHALKNMIRQDDTIVKSAPVSFFNFGGIGSGLDSRQAPDFFRNEFQVCMWFRVETFRNSGFQSKNIDGDDDQQFLTSYNEVDGVKYGFKVFIKNKKICVDIIDSQSASESFEVDSFQLRKGVWYYLVITHQRARYALFNRSKVCIKVDGATHFDHFVGLSESNAKLQAKAPLKNAGKPIEAHMVIGRNFDGQIGAVYYFLEPLPNEAVDVVSRLSARKHVDGYHSNSSIDLVPIVYAVDGKSATINPSILAVFHPSRVVENYALDVHCGRHALLGMLTHAWNMKSARDVLMSLGGVACLLPLFPRLLIENDQARNIVAQESDSIGLGSSPSEIYEDVDCLAYLGESSLEILSIDKIEVNDEGCIGLLLSIVSRCIQAHNVYLRDLAFNYGIGMIEYALSNVSDKILSMEGDTCAVALLELKQVVGGSALLENSAIKHLLSNFKVWSKASVFFQKSLISILHSAVGDQPKYFIRTVGALWFLDQVLFFVPSAAGSKDETADSTPLSDIITLPEGALTPTSFNKKTKRYGSIHVTAEHTEGTDSVLADFKQAAIGSPDANKNSPSDRPPSPSSPKGYSRFKLALNKEMEGNEPESLSNPPTTSAAAAKAKLDEAGDIKTFETRRHVSASLENDNAHKFYMRNNLYSILYILVQNDTENKELESMFSFMDKCKDSTVLNEVSQLLLCFIIEMGHSAVQQIVTACSSPEGFTAFVTFRLVSHPSEDVRSTAIRILTHFYQRLKENTAGPSKPNLISMAQVFDNHKVTVGINRLQDSGGLYLLSKMLENKYCADSSCPTYSALLEMLLTVHGSQKKMYKYADADKNSENAGKLGKSGALRVFALAPFGMTHAQAASGDELDEGINECMLSHLFTIVPKLSDSVEDSLYLDLLTILKHNPENRDAFCANPFWNNFIFQLARRYIITDNDLALVVSSDSLLQCLRNWSDEAQVLKANSPRVSPQPGNRRKPSLHVYTDDGKSLPINSTHDLRFAMSMKLNSTLVVHATKYKNGWLSIFRSLVVMQESGEKEKVVLAQAMLSHAINELTFGMATRFKDLLTKVVSDVPAVKQDAYDQLENFLVLIIIVCLHSVNAPVSSVDTNLFHNWRYLHPTDIKPETSDGKIVVREGAQYIEELLHPLERNHNPDHGKLVLILQCLRFFDVLFSPNDAGFLRNGQILKYCIRNLDKKAAGDQGRERLSLLGAASRMVIFVHKQLCPLSELADINVLRMSHIVKTFDRVPQKNTPTESWVVVIMYNAFQNMRQIRYAMCPLFEEFGLSIEMTVAAMGTLEGILRRGDEDVYESIVSDVVLLTRLEVLFDSKLGTRIINFVRHVVQLLVDVYKARGEFLYACLGDKAYLAYSNFVQLATADLQSSASRRVSPYKRRLSRSSLGSANSDVVRSPSKSVTSEGSEVHDWADVSDPGTEPMDASQAKECFLFDDIISVFRYLRDPFFLLDMSRLEGVASGFDAAKTYEKKCLHDFTEDMKYLQSKMRAVDLGSGKNVGSMPTWSANARVQRFVEMAQAKSVAASWQSCLKTSEAEWSPWSSFEEDGAQTYELTRHADKYLRRIVLTLASEPVDYSECIYYSLKRQGLEPERKAANTSSLDGTLLTAPSSFLRDALKLSMDSRKRNIAEDWGNENSFILEENAPTLMEASKRPQWAMSFEWASDEWIAYTSEAAMVCLEHTMSGTVLLTNKHLYFHPRKQIGGLVNDVAGRYLKTRRWVLECLTESFSRRHLLKNCGIELFFTNTPEIFLSFNSLKELQKFFFTLRRQNVPNLTSPATLNPKQVCASLPWTELWRRRLISNFEYLIVLNKMAGRSFNDLTQYPVFPWIIADYTSKVLDLENPATFRDLSKPIGALNEARLTEVMERYHNSFDDVDIPKFMYGSHYSSAGVVLHYMIRQEPFTAMAVNFQGGKFDCPDRLFFDFRSTWDGLNQSLTDVKECIPEMFCCPEMLINSNKLPLGPLQDGVTHVNDVILPPWASDPYAFTLLQREALESDYVSENIHHWIDLIFGYKQTGEAAIEAHNLFYYLTYENAINIDEIADTVTRDATISQVVNFGQTPSQLFTKPHVQRVSKKDAPPAFCADKHTVVSCNIEIYTYAPQQQIKTKVTSPIISLQSSKTQLVAYHADLTVSYFKFSVTQDGLLSPQQIRFERIRENPCAHLSMHSVHSIKRVANDNDWDSANSRGTSESVIPLEESEESEPKASADGSILGKIGHLFGMAKTKQSQVAHGAQFQFFDEVLDPEHAALTSRHVALSVVDGPNGRIISGGYWDNSLRVHALDTLKEIASANSGHIGYITCIQLDKQGGHLILTGGADGTLRVWLLENVSVLSSFYEDLRPKGVDDTHDDVNLVCVHVLCGHQSPITAMCYSADLDLIFSGSQDGTLCLHSAKRGEFIRLMKRLAGVSIDVLFISTQGFLIAHSWSALKVWLFWINGQDLNSGKLNFQKGKNAKPVQERMECFAVNGPNSDVLACGTSGGMIYFMTMPSLQCLRICDSSANGAVKTLRFSEDNQYLMIGSQNGTFSIAVDPGKSKKEEPSG